MGEEVLDQLDVVSGQGHQVAGAPSDQVGRGQGVELAESVDAHLGQEAEGHVVGDPRLQPVQDPGQGGDDGQDHQPAAEGIAVLECQYDQGAEGPDADEGHNPEHAENECRHQSPLPRGGHPHQLDRQPAPAQALGLDDPLGHRLDRSRHSLAGPIGPRADVGAKGRREGTVSVGVDCGLKIGQVQRLRRRLLGLFRHQVGVGAVSGHEAVMGAALDDATVFEDQDRVAVDHAGQAVGDDQGRPILHESVEGPADDGLVLGIDRRGGLVQHQDRGVPQQGPGDGHPLALASRELDPLLADDGVVAVLQRGHEVVDVGRSGRLFDLGPTGLGPPDAEVVADGAVEEEGVLVDHRDHGPDLLDGEPAKVVATDADRALIRVVEPQQQADNRRLPPAGRPDDPDAAPGGKLEVEALDGRRGGCPDSGTGPPRRPRWE